jgi:hypothetical protein
VTTPVAYKWTGPSGQVEYDCESECSAAAAAIGWRAEPLYDQATLDAAVAAERERIALLCIEREHHFSSSEAADSFAGLVLHKKT